MEDFTRLSNKVQFSKLCSNYAEQTCTVGFFKRFFNASVRITLRKLKLKAICYSLFIISEVKALKTCPGFAISDCM